MTQDITAERSRLMTGGKRGPRLVTNFEVVESLIYTYNDDGTVATLTKDQVREDGTVWRKVLTFTYSAGQLTSKSETLQLLP